MKKRNTKRNFFMYANIKDMFNDNGITVWFMATTVIT